MENEKTKDEKIKRLTCALAKAHERLRDTINYGGDPDGLSFLIKECLADPDGKQAYEEWQDLNRIKRMSESGMINASKEIKKMRAVVKVAQDYLQADNKVEQCRHRTRLRGSLAELDKK